ncbi:zf-ccch type zinc finger protein [Moniliophthora roreri MCA 2997]|uniref:Zf-ccch type zinc finger protein n=1 Tax=Moniliophthora roreri (strain MCA 2997) TaxID=1381753 RepID=V2WP56_MONRO|nr:zf-ccch type zinc finger protein [Moniliophthora roreri MCA 2997]
MPTVDSERDRAKDKDRERDHGTEDSRERAGSKQAKPSSSSSKSKDLSHVPCKFFKVGSCTAGSSCPFSHAVLEPGAQKDVCAWFVKGNCKFGHKCALAHVLPGQSMSMDRKNKKAAQQAAAAAGGDLLTPEERSRRMSRSNSGQGPNGGGGIEPPMLSPTRRAALGVPTTAAAAGHGNNDGAHRYSRSVPATSLLGDISSIWSNTNPAQASPHVGSPLAAGLPSSPGRALGNGTPSSFGAGSPPAFSITPSNASAAFLPGVHAAYYKSKQTQDLGRGVRNVSSPLYGASSGAGAGAGTGAGAGGAGAGTGTLQSSLAAATARLGGGSGYGTPTGTSNGFGDMNIGGGTGIGLGLGVGVGVGVGGQGDVHPHRPNLLSSNSSQAFSSHHHLAHADDPQLALSPGSRALQAHAPGQSLPQGLAAGYSRIHAMPSVGSPGSIGVGGGGYSVSPGATGAFNIGPYGSNAAYARESMGRGETEWSGFGSFTPNNVATPPGLGHLHPVPQQTDDTTSKMSYAKAAKGPVGVGVKSPLSKPVSGGGDDDDLFTLDA